MTLGQKLLHNGKCNLALVPNEQPDCELQSLFPRGPQVHRARFALRNCKACLGSGKVELCRKSDRQPAFICNFMEYHRDLAPKLLHSAEVSH